MEKHWKNQNNKRNEPDGKTKRNKKTNPDTKDRNNEKPRSTKRHTTLKAHTHTHYYIPDAFSLAISMPIAFTNDIVHIDSICCSVPSWNLLMHV